jgi:hypothetical protein
MGPSKPHGSPPVTGFFQKKATGGTSAHANQQLTEDYFRRKN